MPRVKPYDQQNKKLIAMIKYGMSMSDLSQDELSASIKKTRMTLYRRMKKPEGFTLGELRDISSKLHIPIENLVKGEFKNEREMGTQ